MIGIDGNGGNVVSGGQMADKTLEIRTIEEEVVVRGSESVRAMARVRVIWKLGNKGRGKRVHLLEEIGMAVRTTRISGGWVEEEDTHVTFMTPESVVGLWRSCGGGGGHLV